MSHEGVRERLAEFALDLLPASEAADVEEHYAECPLCRIEARMYFQAREALAVGAGALAGDPPSQEDVDALVRNATALLVAPPPATNGLASGEDVDGDEVPQGRRRFFLFGPRLSAPQPSLPSSNGAVPSDDARDTTGAVVAPAPPTVAIDAPSLHAAPPPVDFVAGPGALPGDADDDAAADAGESAPRRSLFARVFRRGPATASDEDEDEDDEDDDEYEDDEDEEEGRVAEWWRGAALMILPTAVLLAGGLVYVMYQWNETKHDLHAAELRAEGHPWRFDLVTQTNDPAQPAAIVYVASNFRDGMLHASRFPQLEQGQHFTVWAEGPTKTQWIAVLRPSPGEREVIADVGPMPEDTERIFVTIELDANGSPTEPVLPAIVSGQRR